MGYIIALFIIIGLIALACCKVSGDCSRQEEQDQDPCETCNRWSECNGVDSNCPWK